MKTPAYAISLAGVFFPRKKFDGLHSWFRIDLSLCQLTAHCHFAPGAGYFLPPVFITFGFGLPTFTGSASFEGSGTTIGSATGASKTDRSLSLASSRRSISAACRALGPGRLKRLRDRQLDRGEVARRNHPRRSLAGASLEDVMRVAELQAGLAEVGLRLMLECAVERG